MVHEKQIVFIKCVTVSTPKWTKDGKKIQRYTNKDTHSIVINRATLQDSGLYTCHGKTLNKTRFKANSIVQVAGNCYN